MKFKTILAAALLAVSLPGCIPLVATGAAVGVSSTIDRRSYGTQIEDNTIEARLSSQLSNNLIGSQQTSVTSYNRIVLLTGRVPAEEWKTRAGQLVSTIQNPTRGVYNEISVGDKQSISTQTSDTYLTSAVKTRLLSAKGVSGNQVKVVTNDSVVYLMGLLTQSEANIASNIAATTSGVVRVVMLAEIISPEQANQLDRPQQNSTTTPQASQSTPQ
jgi:osmotically-inducible protein OsmY